MIDPVAARLLQDFKHGSPLIGCRYDPSGRYLFVSAQDNSIQRYDLLTGRKTALVGHDSWVRGMAMYSGDPERSLEVVRDFRRRRLQAAAIGSVGLLRAVPAAPPLTLVSGDYHGKLIWWNAHDDAPKPQREVDAHGGWVRAVAISPDGKTLASCGNDHLVKLWNLADGKHLKTLEGHESHVYNVAFHPDGKHLVSGDLKGVVKDWDLTTGKAVRDFDAKLFAKYDPTFMADIGGIRSMAFDEKGTTLACAGITNVTNAFAGVGNPMILLFDWKEGKPTQLKPKDVFQGTAWGVGFHPAGYVIAAGGGQQGRVWIWKDAENIATVTVPVNSRDLSLHPDGTTLAVACSDGAARVYTMLPGPVTAGPKKK